MGSSALKVSPKPSGYNSNNRPKMNGYGNMYGAGYGDLSAYGAYGGMSAYGQPLDPSMYGAPAAATYASASAAYAQHQQQQPQVQAVQQVQQGVGNFPATPQQLAAYQQQQAAHYQQQQAAGANLPPPRDFSTLSPVEQDTLLQQMGLDRSQVATNVQMQPAVAQAQTQQQYQYAVAPSQAAQQQQPVEQQQQYLPVPEAPPHYSNRYNHSREAQGQPAQVVYQQQQQQAHQLPQRQVQTPPPPQYVYERYAPPPPPLRREHRHRGDGRVYFPPREATIDELLDFLPPRPGVYQARPPRQRLPPLSHDLVYSKPRRVIDDDDYEGYVVESRYMKRRPSLSTRSKSHECCPPHHHRPRNARLYSDEDFYSDYSDYSDY